MPRKALFSLTFLFQSFFRSVRQKERSARLLSSRSLFRFDFMSFCLDLCCISGRGISLVLHRTFRSITPRLGDFTVAAPDAARVTRDA